MILGCGGKKEEQHYEKEGKLYGSRPFAHCDTDCPYTEGTCISRCSHLGWNQRPCLKADYTGRERTEDAWRNREGMRQEVKIANKREAEKIIEEIDGLVKKGQTILDKQKYDYEFAKMFLSEIKKRRKRES